MDATNNEAELTERDVELLRDVAAAGWLRDRAAGQDMARLEACGLVTGNRQQLRLTHFGRIRAVLWEGWAVGPCEGS